MSSASPSEVDAALLREHDARLTRLLADAEAACGPVAWPRVESVITALVELYGVAIERLIASARELAPDGAFDARIDDDELVSSLLLLHGLHPVTLEKRIAHALDRLRNDEPHAAPLTLVGIVDDVARLRPSDPNAPFPPPPTYVVVRAIERAAPELSGVQIESARPAHASGLVPAEHLVRRSAR